VREIPSVGEGPGRPARLVEVRPDGVVVVGIDAGGSMLRAVRANLGGGIEARAAHPARDPRDGEALIDEIVELARGVAGEGPRRRLVAVVAGISGIVDHAEGRVLHSPDLPGLVGLPVAARLEDRLGTPVEIDNDDLLAAVGEAADGAARGCADVVFLSLGYGLGAGLIVGGRPVRGASSAAGAIAYLGGGRIEALASGRAIPLRYAEAVGRRGASTDATGMTVARVDARGVFDLAARGDAAASEVIGEAVDALAEAVADVAALLDPDVVVLGGGLAANGAAVFEPIVGRLREILPFPPRVVPSALDTAAVVHGAVELAVAIALRDLARDGVRRASPLAPATHAQSPSS
jgi:predicted NBD/HSP70 family sugar kinase